MIGIIIRMILHPMLFAQVLRDRLNGKTTDDYVQELRDLEALERQNRLKFLDRLDDFS